MLVERPFQSWDDLRHMVDLARRFPDDNLHAIDLPYRFSSWAFEDPENFHLWLAGGELVAWAVLQAPFWFIDLCVDPEAGAGLYAQALSWAWQRALAVQGTRNTRPVWFVNVFERQGRRRAALEEAGFADQAAVAKDPWSKVWMSRSLPIEESGHPLPPGYRVRPLSGEAEAAEYVALHRLVFQSENMSLEWRLRTLAQPGYMPELDLVAEAPDGTLAAFCVLWSLHGLGGKLSGGQVEPMGVHPDHRRIGLGRAILVEGLRRLTALGARRAFVETDGFRDAAFGLYESVGFRVKEKVLVYRKDV